jgi:hypothetical protein
MLRGMLHVPNRVICMVMLLYSTMVAAVEPSAVSTFWRNGTQIDQQTLDGVTVLAWVTKTGKYQRVNVQLENHSQHAIDFQPTFVGLSGTGQKNVALKLLSEEELRKSISRREFWGTLMVGLYGAVATETSTVRTTTSSGYSVRSTINSPDYFARADAQRTQRELAANAQTQREEIGRVLLRRTTVFPNDSVGGSMFFKNAGKMDGFVVTLSLGDRNYRLPFGTASSETVVANFNPLAIDASRTQEHAKAVAESHSATKTSIRPTDTNPENRGFIGAAFQGNPNTRHDGVELSSVDSGGPAETAGLRAKDEVTAIDGTFVFTANELTKVISEIAPGSTVEVRYRRGNQIESADVVIGDRLSEVSRAGKQPEPRN